MAEASPCRKPAALMEPARAPASHAPSVRVALTPTRAQKKRRVPSGNKKRPMSNKRREERLASAHELQRLHAIHKRQEKEQVRTARQRFVPDSEDEDTAASSLRKAKKQLEAVSKRQVVVGKWKRMARSKADCQMFESVSKAKDHLREIMSVFSTDNEAEFHRSMEAVFGDQYVYGVMCAR
eukprot:jgi/Phyca11/20821/fgenesh1_pg.PHYCAscaffold_73_\